MAKTKDRPVSTVERNALTKQEAAASLGMSVDHFERRVQPFVKVIRIGTRVYVRPAELERWVRESGRYIA